MTRCLLVGATVAFVLMQAAHSDTLYLKNGVIIQKATIVEERDADIVVDINGKRFAYRRDEIDRIEPGDAAAEIDEKALRDAENKERADLQSLTGLTEEQRNEVNTLFSKLQSSDRIVSVDAHQELVAMGQRLDLMKYLEYVLPSLSPRLMPKVLGVMCDLEPARSIPALRTHALDPAWVTRAAVFELLGKARDGESIPVIARGLVDHRAEVRMAAANSLAALNAKHATPALIDNLKHADPRVRNAAQTALAALWSTPDHAVNFFTAEEWGQFWNDRAGSMPGVITTDSLEPIVTPETEWRDE